MLILDRILLTRGEEISTFLIRNNYVLVSVNNQEPKFTGKLPAEYASTSKFAELLTTAGYSCEVDSILISPSNGSRYWYIQ